MSHQDDPDARRAALAAKRDALYAQQAERTARQQHAEKVAAFHRYHGAALEAAGVRFELLWDTDTRRGPLTLYPIGFASVNWDLVPHAVVEHGATQGHLAELLDELARLLDLHLGLPDLHIVLAGEPDDRLLDAIARLGELRDIERARIQLRGGQHRHELFDVVILCLVAHAERRPPRIQLR